MNQLGDALRAWRDRLDPVQAGLPSGSSRRVPGLRRAELAMLAGISVEYVVRLLFVSGDVERLGKIVGRQASKGQRFLTIAQGGFAAGCRELLVAAGRRCTTAGRGRATDHFHQPGKDRHAAHGRMLWRSSAWRGSTSKVGERLRLPENVMGRQGRVPFVA